MTDSKPRRGRRPASAPSGREALLDAAIACFAQNGYAGTSLRQLAGAAGVDVALAARLFGSKAGLWQAAVAQLLARQAEHTPQLEALVTLSADDPAAALTRFIRLFTDLSFEMPSLTRFLLQEIATEGARKDEILKSVIGHFRHLARPVLQRAMNAGVIGGSDTDIVFSMLLAAVSLPLTAPAMFLGVPDVDEALRDKLAQQAIATFVRAPVGPGL